jgi:hypothetical protein
MTKTKTKTKKKTASRRRVRVRLTREKICDTFVDYVRTSFKKDLLDEGVSSEVVAMSNVVERYLMAPHQRHRFVKAIIRRLNVKSKWDVFNIESEVVSLSLTAQDILNRKMLRDSSGVA